ncbi:MAG TPA: hemerythrin domain-containing protein [Pseudomonadales bacterium]
MIGGSSGSAGVDLFRRLTDEHAVAAELMQQVAGSMELPTREDLYPQIRRQLLVHARAEEQAFYPRLAAHPELRALVERSLEEHAEVERFLKRLDVKDRSTKQWRDLFGEMVQAVQAHVAREEQELFPLARRLLDPLELRRIHEDYDRAEDRDGFR